MKKRGVKSQTTGLDAGWGGREAQRFLDVENRALRPRAYKIPRNINNIRLEFVAINLLYS
jgi:hypothetical protein